MSNTQTIDVLNDVTQTLIDSCKGYEMCSEMSDDSFALQSEFRRLQSEREALVTEMQVTTRSLGGTPETEGSASGAVHRGFTKFSSLFQDDTKAAISAIDDGEEHLADTIENKLEDNRLPMQVASILRRAHASAKSGERFADMLED